MLLDKQGVEATIPHRSPMLLVDEVVTFDKEKALVHARKHTNPEDMYFKGHFPGNPIMPGVITLEALAQTSALYVCLHMDKTAEETYFYFMSVEECKFRKPVLPNQTIDLYITCAKQRGTVFKFEGEAHVDGEKIANAAFTAKVVLKEDEK